jgi:vancomycin resistance protein VanW
LIPWKRSLRIQFKHTQNWLRGYSLQFTRQQTPDQAHRYGHEWSQSTTIIPDRGTPEVRRNRIVNLQIATRKIHHLRLNPGQLFSFCHVVGDPSLRNGFQPGPVFVGGHVRTGVGGGLCLIATNLFRTFLMAGCQILERHCHSIDAYGADRFYDLGQDASIAYGYKDLIIRNQSSIPLQVRIQVLPEAGQVISSLWGQAPRPWDVHVQSNIIQELPPIHADGLPGWIVDTHRSLRHHSSIAHPSHGTAWQPDYHGSSLYHPCAPSPPAIAPSESQGA